MDQPNTQSINLDKSLESAVNTPDYTSSEQRIHSSESTPFPIHVLGRLAQWNTKIEGLAGLEARGIARVPPDERHRGSFLGYAQMAMLWFSTNVTANNLAVGLLGPLVYDLGFVDAVMMATFGALLGSAGTAYMSIWGAQSGNRTMVCWRSLYSAILPHSQNYTLIYQSERISDII